MSHPKKAIAIFSLSVSISFGVHAENNIFHSKLVDDSLKQYIASEKHIEGEKIKVAIGLTIRDKDYKNTNHNVEEIINFNKKRSSYSLKVNGRHLNQEETLNHVNKEKELKKQKRTLRLESTKNVAEQFILRMDWLDDESIRTQVNAGARTLKLSLTTKEIEKIIKKADEYIAGIELVVDGSDDIAQAMTATRTIEAYNSSRFPNALGQNVGIYMTEVGCPPENFNNNFLQSYTRLSGTTDSHSENVASIIRHVSGESHLYCRAGASIPFLSDLDGVNGNPAILVTTRSHSVPTNFNYSLLDRDWDNLVFEEGVVSFNSAANLGLSTNEVRSPAKGYNIITVGNYNDANNLMASNSSSGNSLLGNQKPEIVAPGVNITAGGHTLSGTSMSTPHAAAMTANLMSYVGKLSSVKPAMYKAWIMAGATDFIGGGYNATGAGGIDFVDTIEHSNLWTGWYPSLHFPRGSTFSVPTTIPNSAIDRSKAHQVRIVLTWLNDGDHTYVNRNNGNSLSKDFDMHIYKNGVLQWRRENRFDPFEMMEFHLAANSTDSYSIKIIPAAEAHYTLIAPMSVAIVYEEF